MRIATWNINSVRLRLPLVAQLAQRFAPDVICLQETKVVDDSFPRTALADLGYPHVEIRGMKGYNGVAILSRLPLQPLERRIFCGRDDCRHVAVRIDGIDLHSLYIPSGGDVPDPSVNDKFAHKLDFLDEFAAWSLALRRQGGSLAVVGDFNVAPLETDVWSHTQLRNVVSHTPIEVEKLTHAQAEGAWVDAVRQSIAPEERLYSWWSYRARDWSASDRGRRLDHIWVSPGLAPRLQGASVIREARGWDKPSDHVPVLADFAV